MTEALPFRHEMFLRDMQSWVHLRYPTRQLSATDVFYALQWASSGLTARDFTAAFDVYLSQHPEAFERGCRLSRLKYEAQRVMREESRRRSSLPAARPAPDCGDAGDPYEIAICRIIECGKQTRMPPLRDILRKAYTAMAHAHRVSAQAFADRRLTPENYAEYKAKCLIDYDAAVDEVFRSATELLAREEIEKLRALTQKEKIRAFRLGDEAKERFLARVFRQNEARYFGIEKLLKPL